MTNPTTISPDQAWKDVRDGRARLIDIREPGEFNTSWAPHSINLPLSSLEENVEQVPTGQQVYILCATGNRARAAAKIFQENKKHGLIIEGGLIEWGRLGLPLENGQRRVWPMDRQVRFAAGILVLTGMGLGFFVHPGFFGISVFVGAGLTFSGLTNFCGMALVLAKMPWNKK